jgi:hypothetical protein
MRIATVKEERVGRRECGSSVDDVWTESRDEPAKPVPSTVPNDKCTSSSGNRELITGLALLPVAAVVVVGEASVLFRTGESQWSEEFSWRRLVLPSSAPSRA